MKNPTKKRIFPKEEYCLGCHLCEIYCISAHSKEKNLVKLFKMPNRPYPRIVVEEKEGEYITFALQCRHCDEPYCITACISGALQMDQNKNLIICDEEKCVGCWSCILVCPYGAIRRNENKKIASKCDLCIERGIPACVENCPNEALELREV